MTDRSQIQEMIKEVPEKRLDELKLIIEQLISHQKENIMTEEEHRFLMKSIQEISQRIPSGEQESTSQNADKILYDNKIHP